jgi:hypothetical protein
MKRSRLVISTLLLFLVVQLLAIAEPWRVKAELWCDDLRGCKGAAGCTEYGAVESPCVLRCNDGTLVSCLKGEEEE